MSPVRKAEQVSVSLESGRGRWRAVAVAIAAVLAVAGCSGSDEGAEGDRPAEPEETSTTLPALDLPRYRTDGLRLEVSPAEPLAIYNVYPSDAQPELIEDVVDLWPEDLLPYLAIQIVPTEVDKLPHDQQVAALDSMLDAADAAEVPVILQTMTFSGPKGPGDEAVDAAFAEHPSLVGIGVAELSADYQASVGGMKDDQRVELAKRIEQAARNDALLLWADMGYLGPQVFVDAGADETLYPLMREHRDNIVVQVKQNGLGRRFGTQSAALGMYLSGMAGAWGINSEDWLWWEASLEQLGGPQVPGGLTAEGMVRSDYPTRARLTYPEALFGTEMLVIAASGGSVFSIEAPWRGTIDPAGTGEISPAGEQVVFPVLRRLIAGRLIPEKDEVAGRISLALQPAGHDDTALATDEVFSHLYGPEGCTPDDRLMCAQRQWLPSTGRYAMVPTLPVLAGEDVTGEFAHVMTPTAAAALPPEELAALATAPLVATGTAWAAPAVGDDTWFVANPNESEDLRATFELPPLSGAHDVVISGDLGRHAFAMIDGRDGLSLFVDNYRTDSDRLWEENISEDALGEMPQDEVGDAPADTTELSFAYGASADRPRLVVEGGESEQTWDPETGTLTVTITHRGPVEIIGG
jgi:hypothetical protein